MSDLEYTASDEWEEFGEGLPLRLSTVFDADEWYNSKSRPYFNFHAEVFEP